MSELRSIRSILSGRSLPHALTLYRLADFHRGDLGDDAFPLGHLEAVQSLERADFVGAGMLEGSDYSGGSLVRANRRAVDEEFGDLEGLKVRFHGGHNTEGMIFRLDVAHEQAPAVLELLEGLEDNPVVDDEVLSTLEREEEDEEWENNARAEFVRALEKACGLDRGDLQFPDGAEFELWREANANGDLVVHEEASGPYFDVDKAAERLSPALVFYLGSLDPVVSWADAVDLFRNGDETDQHNAFRLLRLVRAGEVLRKLEKRTAELLANDVDPENGPRIEQGRDKVRSEILGARFDLGDVSAPLDRASLENVPLRSFQVTFRRFWHNAPEQGPTVGTYERKANGYGGGFHANGELSFSLDPFDTKGEYLEVAEKLAAFLK